MNPRGYILYVAGGILAAVILATYLFAQPAEKQVPGIPAASSTSQMPTASPPTPEIQKVLAESHGFQAFVSYTDSGFKPGTVAIKRGDTVRFTNNSSKDLWVAAGGKTLYPATANGCGSSAFDTCKALKRGEFWEFTFTISGDWEYRDTLHKDATGTVRVK